MGYTHYWYRPIEVNEEMFAKISEDLKKLPEIVPIKVEGGTIIIRGTCETFIFPKILPEEMRKFFVSLKDGRIFQFVKTNHGEYDVVVQMALIVAKQHLKNELLVVSDGGGYEWKEAKKLVYTVLGYGENFSLDDSPSFEEMNVNVTWSK